MPAADFLGSTGARVTGVEISPCDSEPCALRRGVNYIARVTFMANKNVDSTGLNVHGTVGYRPMVVPLPSNGVCVFLFPPCPIEAGGSYVYSYTGAVPPDLSLGLTTLRWELLDGTGASFVCIEIPVRVV
ncbi:Phosphatidylglycerol/phosphatidylinositol transfer protein [Clonorchis sinensis]|uniref:Phosphatidylglycerol/phosphatidylinositol transfer protein n=1 Tax=Clonorchis sinensis TaxID=79923 RepID=A0A8T1N007_CLOSI|nr:Phosphatidylglycerol/phosphatidylinositol transfer protein [Clonorchis sinensis]